MEQLDILYLSSQPPIWNIVLNYLPITSLINIQATNKTLCVNTKSYLQLTEDKTKLHLDNKFKDISYHTDEKFFAWINDIYNGLINKVPKRRTLPTLRFMSKRFSQCLQR